MDGSVNRHESTLTRAQTRPGREMRSPKPGRVCGWVELILGSAPTRPYLSPFELYRF